MRILKDLSFALIKLLLCEGKKNFPSLSIIFDKVRSAYHRIRVPYFLTERESEVFNFLSHRCLPCFLTVLLFGTFSNAWADFFPYKAFIANFKEIVTYPSMGVKKTFSGKIYYKKPYSIRMEVLSPDTELIITNGVKGWWVLESEGKVKESNVEGLKNSLPLHFLSGEKDTLWKITKTKRDTIDFYFFYPVSTNPFQDTISIEMRSGLPSELEIKKTSGETLKFHFYNVKPRHELPDSLFLYNKGR